MKIQYFGGRGGGKLVCLFACLGGLKLRGKKLKLKKIKGDPHLEFKKKLNNPKNSYAPLN